MGHLLAYGLKKLMPETMGPIFENLNVNKLVQLLERKDSDKNITDEADRKNKKLALNQISFPKTTVQTPLVKKDKKSKLVTAKEEEKRRRKKRKKKEEKAADKKPTLSVVKVADTKTSPKKNFEEDVVTGILISTVEKKKEEKPAEEKPNEDKVDLKYWAKLLNEVPTTDNLKKFVGLYKSRKINSKNYYSVLSSLISSSHKDARRLAVLGSSIEPSPLAFEILANIKHTETETELLTLTNARLQVFKDVKYLEFLIQPLRSNDLFSKLEATALIGQIATSLNGEQALTGEVQRSLNVIASILKAYSQNSNAQLQSISGQALTVITRLLGNIA